jgi:hypothetical protein
MAEIGRRCMDLVFLAHLKKSSNFNPVIPEILF